MPDARCWTSSVDEPATSGDIWWGRIKQKLAVDKFEVLKGRVQAYLQGHELFIQGLYAGADPTQRVRVRLVTTGAWHTLFARNMFIRPPADELGVAADQQAHPCAGHVSFFVRLHGACCRY
jgi:ATP-dependent phosphoenolpyruvate carboxykinase